jgi:hypothetical protein
MIHAFLFYMTTNIIVMYVKCKNKLKLLGKTMTNGRKLQEEDECEKVDVERLLRGLWEPHEALLMR